MNPLLTLVMIVRDEAEALPAFFAHHVGLWDEAVVVDTGSGDGTAAVAAAAGARVIHVPWRDDFAAARNAGLERAAGDRLLLLDADERIAARDFDAVRDAAREAPCAWLQETVNYCAERSHLEWRPTRGLYPGEEAGHCGYFISRRVGLFPRDAALRFRGRIHESVLPDCERAGLPLRPLAVPVHHYGYVRSPLAAARRRATYERLAALKLADDPDDPAARLEHATALLESGRAEEAAAELVSLVVGPGHLRPVTRGRFLLARLRREEGRTNEAEALLAAANGADPGFLFAWLERVRLLAAAQRWREVFALLEAARAAGNADDEPLLDREELLALVRTGQLPAALACARRLAVACPQWPEVAALRDRLARLEGADGSAAEGDPV